MSRFNNLWLVSRLQPPHSLLIQCAEFSHAQFWLSLGWLFGQPLSALLMPAEIPASRISTGTTLSRCLFLDKLELSKQPAK